MRIGQLSEKSGLSRDTIRFYERNGLITSVAGASDTNNYRDYPENNLLWLEFISGAREAGMSIADLRDILEAIGGSCDIKIGRKVISEKIKELEERSQQIQRAVGFLENALEKI